MIKKLICKAFNNQSNYFLKSMMLIIKQQTVGSWQCAAGSNQQPATGFIPT
jgi:hypothetical protein